jgi:prolyl-tRNA synthetase
MDAIDMKAKKSNFSEWYTELLKEAKLCDLRYNVKGFVVFQPNSVITMKIMYDMYEAELEKNNHLPAWFPALIPESNFTREGEHVKGFVPEVFWVEKSGDNPLEERLAMRPTSETAMYQMYSLWIQGASDLPLKIYQSCQVWRCETKATRPFIRSREFYWIEAHDCFATREGAVEQVKEDMEMAENVIHKHFGVPFIFFKRPQWDKFPGAEETFAADCLMPDGKALQLPSTHLLGQNFAKPFDVKYLNEKGEPTYVWQTCYGPAISRIYAAVISTHGDDNGLVLPFELAPVQVVVVPIVKGDGGAAIEDKAKEIAKELSSFGFRAKADLSPNTPGFKFNEWELLGAPIRIEIGAKELGEKTLTLAPRHTGKREKIPEKDLSHAIKLAAKSLNAALLEKADAWFSKMMHKANSTGELKGALEKGGFVQVPFCSISMDGEGCAKEIKEKLSGDVRGVRHDKHEQPKREKCIACGKDAKEYVYVARQY